MLKRGDVSQYFILLAINHCGDDNRYCCHELFGFDVMLDKNLKPWILEVNISPRYESVMSMNVHIDVAYVSLLISLS